jgi:hypothetical protein
MTEDFLKSDAMISACSKYRYQLYRRWAKGKQALFVMLNPSTADATEDDPTIRRCIGFAKREGCGSLVVVNLFAFRATSPVKLLLADDPIGAENDGHIWAAMANADGPIIAAWGAHGVFMDRDKDFRRLIDDKAIYCLGKTMRGQPKHPLYIKADQPLIRL